MIGPGANPLQMAALRAAIQRLAADQQGGLRGGQGLASGGSPVTAGPLPGLGSQGPGQSGFGPGSLNPGPRPVQSGFGPGSLNPSPRQLAARERQSARMQLAHGLVRAQQMRGLG